MKSTKTKIKMMLNPDAYVVLLVKGKLEKNKKTFGEPYCPCQTPMSKDTICPCKYYREDNACRCGLYVPTKGDEK